MTPEELRDQMKADLGDAAQVIAEFKEHFLGFRPDPAELVQYEFGLIVELAKMLQAERHNR